MNQSDVVQRSRGMASNELEEINGDTLSENNNNNNKNETLDVSRIYNGTGGNASYLSTGNNTYTHTEQNIMKNRVTTIAHSMTSTTRQTQKDIIEMPSLGMSTTQHHSSMTIPISTSNTTTPTITEHSTQHNPTKRPHTHSIVIPIFMVPTLKYTSQHRPHPTMGTLPPSPAIYRGAQREVLEGGGSNMHETPGTLRRNAKYIVLGTIAFVIFLVTTVLTACICKR